MNNYNFGNYICELREKKGLSQSELGAKLGVTNKAVSRWENGGAYPSTELMLPLAKELGVPLEDLYKVISDDKTPKTKLHRFLERIARCSKIITVISLIWSVVLYVLFLCFYTGSIDKIILAIAAPIVCAMVYGIFYVIFLVFSITPLASAKIQERVTAFILIAMCLGSILMLSDFIQYFPHGFYASTCVPNTALMSVAHSLKRKYFPKRKG